MVSSLFCRASSHSHDEIHAGMKLLEWTFFAIDSSFWSFPSLAIYLGTGWDKKTMIYKVGRTSPTQIKGNPNKSESNKTGSGMFSRNIQSCAQLNSQVSTLPGSKEQAAAFSSVSGAWQVCSMAQKALPKTKGTHWNSPTSIKVFPSLKAYIAFMDLKPSSFRQLL